MPQNVKKTPIKLREWKPCLGQARRQVRPGFLSSELLCAESFEKSVESWPTGKQAIQNTHWNRYCILFHTLTWRPFACKPLGLILGNIYIYPKGIPSCSIHCPMFHMFHKHTSFPGHPGACWSNVSSPKAAEEATVESWSWDLGNPITRGVPSGKHTKKTMV